MRLHHLELDSPNINGCAARLGGLVASPDRALTALPINSESSSGRTKPCGSFIAPVNRCSGVKPSNPASKQAEEVRT